MNLFFTCQDEIKRKSPNDINGNTQTDSNSDLRSIYESNTCITISS